MREALIELGCDIIQGYHIARPMPHAAFVTWARAHD
jgi:EAL domain-containing protein (putative c-di-GMP-specific phosphodiesterase class I)